MAVVEVLDVAGNRRSLLVKPLADYRRFLLCLLCLPISSKSVLRKVAI